MATQPYRVPIGSPRHPIGCLWGCHRVPIGCLELVITGLITASYALMIPRNSAHMTAATSLLACSSSRMASYALDPAKSLSLSAVSSRTARAFSAES